MFRPLMLVFVGLLGLTLAAGTAAADKKAAEKELKGQGCCAKCELGQGSKCATVIKVKEGGKDVVYFFDEASDKKYHQDYCKGTKDITVKGTVSEKDGKKIITVTSLEKAK